MEAEIEMMSSSKSDNQRQVELRLAIKDEEGTKKCRFMSQEEAIEHCKMDPLFQTIREAARTLPVKKTDLFAQCPNDAERIKLQNKLKKWKNMGLSMMSRKQIKFIE